VTGLAAVLLVLAAGCGGDDGKATYEDAVTGYFAEEEPATDDYEQEAEEADDLAGFAEVLDEGLEGSERRFRDFREDADPPDDVADVHDDLVDTVSEELRLGGLIVEAARAGDEERVAELEDEDEEVVERFDDLQDRFDDKGYEVELPEP
jgi:hypothetical protein